MLHGPIDFLGWNQYIVNNLDNAISSDAILNCHCRESIDFDLDESPIATYVDAEGFTLKKGCKIDLYFVGQYEA